MNNIFVTGANRGIGYGIFKYLLKKNIGKNYYLGCRDIKKGEIAIKNLEKENINEKKIFHLLKVDLEEEKTFRNIFSGLKDEKIDILINNAAINSFEDNDLKKCKQILKINYENTKNLIEEIKKKDKLNKKAIILNISSYYSKLTILKNKDIKEKIKNIKKEEDIKKIKNEYINNFPESKKWYTEKWPCKTYSFSKLLLNYYTKLLSRDKYIVEKNIKVYTVHPGWVRTDMGGVDAPENIEYGVKSVLDPIFFDVNDYSLQGEFLFFGKKDMKL